MVVLALALASTAEAADLVARGVVMVFYSANDAHQIALVRADRIFVDHQQMGFFRIGVLPFVAAENVWFDIRDAAETSKKLSSIHAQFARRGVDGPIELRNVSFSFPTETTPRLQAKIIRLRADGVWHVLDGVVADRDGRTHFIEATLQPAGSLAGRLSFQGGINSRTVDLFTQSKEGDTPLQAKE